MTAGTGLVGRQISLTVGGATLLGVVTKDFSITSPNLDVTDDQSSGNQELLAIGGTKATNVSISGITKNYELLATMSGASQMVACSWDLGDGASTESNYAFSARMSDLSFTNPANEICEFSAELSSSGAQTFTAGT